MQANTRGPVYASVQAHLGYTLTPAERHLIDKALDQIRAMRDLLK
jgi:hypothetical protein